MRTQTAMFVCFCPSTVALRGCTAGRVEVEGAAGAVNRGGCGERGVGGGGDYGY